MFVRSLFLRGRETPIILQYKTRDTLEIARAAGDSPIADDFGRVFFAQPSEIIGDLTTDIAREFEANGEVALLQAREQARLNTRAANDPVMKFAAAGRPTGLVG
jgi:hypothetical protein